jgi:hypothetical protein
LLFLLYFYSIYVNVSFAPICSYIRDIGGLVIIDEVQTGLGRVGAYTWGFQAIPKKKKKKTLLTFDIF